MPPAHKDNVDVELRRVRNRELELKRITGEISCAECRRLKLKCDKKVPCSSCVRRGCKQICPTGTSTGITGRQMAINAAPLPVSSNNDTSHKLVAMSERIRVLEDALEIESGNTCHPLLAPEFLAIKQGIDVVDRRLHGKANDDGEEELAGAFGTLSVSDGKTMRYLGASAADSALLMEVMDPATEAQCVNYGNLPRELIQASAMWPFAPAYLSIPEHISQIVSQLPPYERVTSLLEAYFSNLAWFVAPLDRSQVMEDVIPLFYPNRRPVAPHLVEQEKLHELALLLILFACGSVADLTQSSVNPEGQRFEQLARAALGMRSFIDYGSLAACQTLFLMGSYEIHSGRKASQESSWKYLSLGLTIAASIGLHRDSSRWKLDPKMVDWRRRTFWEMNTTDKWKSLGSGRPMMFPPYAVDCEFPFDRGATVEEDGVVVESVWQWRYRFTTDVVAFLVEKICAARPPKYSDIMEMDKRVRDFELHPFVHQRPKPTAYRFETDGDYRNLHPYITLWWKEMALLYVHRNCFARALLEFPDDPIRSPFGPSFLSAYRTSTTLLTVLYEAQNRMSLILERLWALWAISLSCAVMIGTVACKPSTISFAGSALKEFEKAIDVFERGATHPVARNSLKLLYRLRDKANAAFQAHKSQGSPSLNVNNSEKSDPSLMSVSRLSRPLDRPVENSEELDILRGTTRYVEQRNVLPVEEPHSQPYVTYGYSSPASTSYSMTASPGTGSSIASGFASSPRTPAATSSCIRESVFSNIIRTRGVDTLLGPSPLVQTDGNKSGNASSPFAPCGETCTDQYDNYLPPFVKSKGTHTPADPSAAEANTAAIISEKLIAEQEQFTGSFQGQTSQTQHHDAAVSPAFSFPSTTHDPLTLSNFSSQGQNGTNGTEFSGVPHVTNAFPASEPRMFPLYDSSLDPTEATDSFFSTVAPDSQMMAELNALYQKDDPNSVEAWNSFMRQFEPVNSGNTEFDSWEAMVFS
ncbi:hypothetical protein ACEPAH_3872 [Sanghuangporus vaninii]